MAKKVQLFFLIKALSKAEKRYFKLYWHQTEGVSNYLLLFDAIDAQTVYDEAAIRKKFRQKAFCKQLHVTKNYLRQLILKSLRNFHHKISKDAELKDALRNIEILYHKELFDLCATEIRKAETIARSFELNNGLAEIMGWKRKLEQAMHTHQYTIFAALLDEQEKAIHAMHNTNLFWKQAVLVSRTAISNTTGSRKIKQVKAATLKNALTLEAKVLYYNTSYLTFLRNGLQDKAEQSLTDLLKLLEKYPHRIQEDPVLYISSANNLVSFFVFTKQYDKAMALISKSRALVENAMEQHEKKSLLKQILRMYNIELEIFRDKKNFAQHLPVIGQIESFITRHEAKIPPDYLLSFWFQLANIHFMRKEADQSLKWINQILNAKWQQVRTDLQVYVRMLNLMIHMEQDNLFVLRYFVDSTRRFLKKVEHTNPVEQILLSFFSKIGQTPKYEHKDRFRDLQQQLFPAGVLQEPATTGDYIDYKSWIQLIIGHP